MLGPWARTSGLMLAILIAAGSCAGQRPKAPAAPTGEQIVQSMVAAYQHAASYEDHGVFDIVFSGPSTHTRHAEFDTAFTRTSGFRHEVRDEWGGSPVITWMTDGKLRRYVPGGTIEPTEALGGPRFYSAVPRMLLPTAARDHGMSDLKHSHVVGAGEVIDGNLCWRVVALRASGGELTLWIDQATYLLRRTVAREHFPAGIEGGAFDTETTTRYRPVVNVEIAASRLAGPDPRSVPPPRSEPWIGVEVTANAAQVIRVRGRTPAERAGLQPGDALVSIDGLTIPDSDALFRVVRQKGVGATVALVIRRGDSSRSINVEIADRAAYWKLQRDLLNRPAPPFSATAVNGSYPASLADLSGHLIILDFTPPNFVRCENCETPAGTFMNKLQETYGARGVRVIGVSTEDAPSLKRVAIELGLKYPLVHDGDAKIANTYFVESPMTTIVIDKAGIVRFVASRTGLEVLVQHLLEPNADK